jgi:glycosyltransferase involved in cell wall biosynthesis
MISIVIATYNRAATIARSIESILVQGDDVTEIVIVDDGSSDETETIVRTFGDPRIIYHRLRENKGASFARNQGIEIARGAFIMVWDSDDLLYPGALHRVLSEFTRDSSLNIVSAPARVVVGGKELSFPRVASGEMIFEDIFCKKIGSNEKIRVARAETMKEVSYKSRHIDFLVNVELIERGRWYHIDECLGDVFNDPEEGSLTAARKKRSKEGSIDRAPHLASFLDRHRNALLGTSPRRYADYCYGAAIGFLLRGDRKRARSFAWDAWHYHPTSCSYFMLWKLSWIPGGARILNLFYQ